MTVDATGVYVAGWTYGNLPSDAFVRKYDTAGNEVWARQFGGPSDDAASGVAVDATGVYVVGYIRKGTPGQSRDIDAFVRKYGSAGDLLWERQSGAPPTDGAASVAVDATGIYVVGGTDGSLPGQCQSGEGDAWVRKYDAAGNTLWTRQFGTPGLDYANSVALDANGVYVAEGSRGARFTQSGGGDAVLAKFERTPAAVTGSGPQIVEGCVVNAASYLGGGVSPGEIVTIFGSRMGPSQLTPLQVTAERRLATMLDETRILFNGVPAPLIYVSVDQSSAIVPYAVASRPTVDVQVVYRGVSSNVVTVPVLPARPAIFTLDSSGAGQGAILNEDGSVNSPANPAQRGSIVSIYATGEGLTNPPGIDGAILSDVLPKPRLEVRAFARWCDDFDGTPLGVLYAGGVSGSVAGLLQINARLPTFVEPGNALPICLMIGSEPTDLGVTITVR